MFYLSTLVPYVLFNILFLYISECSTNVHFVHHMVYSYTFHQYISS